MYRSIMVPLDGSGFSEGALPVAVTLGRALGSRLELVLVHELLRIEGAETWRRHLAERDAGYLSTVAEAIRKAGVQDVGTTTLEGPVAERLREHADASGAELIVMTTHGRGGFARAWLGSVSDRLVRTSTVPLLLVRPGETVPSVGEEVRLADFVVAVDGSVLSESIVEPVLALAAELGARATLLRVVEEPIPPGMVFMPEGFRDREALLEESEREAAAYLSDLAARVQRPDVELATHVSVGGAAPGAILAHADERSADLIALSTRGHGGLERAVLGSVTDKVVRGSGRPVLVFPPPSGAE